MNLVNNKINNIRKVAAFAAVFFVCFFFSFSQVHADVTMAAVAIEQSPSSCGSTRLTWDSVDATSVTIDNGVGSVAPSGETFVSPTNITTYTITGTNSSGGYASASATVYPTPCSTPTNVVMAAVSIEQSPSSTCGQPTRLSWASTDATSINISGIGSVAPYGETSVSPSSVTIYTITGTNSTGGYASASATVYPITPCSTPTPPTTCTTGNIVITVNGPQSAAYYITRPDGVRFGWNGSHTFVGEPAGGTYTLRADNVAGYATPVVSPSSGSVPACGTAYATITYTALPTPTPTPTPVPTPVPTPTPTPVPTTAPAPAPTVSTVSNITNSATITNSNCVNVNQNGTATQNSTCTTTLAASPIVVPVNNNNQCYAPQITSPLSATASTGQYFSYYVTGNSASAATYYVSSLPAGLTFNSTTNMISGTPTQSGTYTVTLNGYNNCNGTDSRVLTIYINNYNNYNNNYNNADLGVIKTVDRTQASSGEIIIYTIKVTNYGPSTATNVVTTDVLPNGVVYYSSSNTVGYYNPSNGVWNVGTLYSGSSAVLKVYGTLQGYQGQIITNTVSTRADQNDQYQANNTARVDVKVRYQGVNLPNTAYRATSRTIAYVNSVTNNVKSALVGTTTSNIDTATSSEVGNTETSTLSTTTTVVTKSWFNSVWAWLIWLLLIVLAVVSYLWSRTYRKLKQLSK
ncbi:DUF11 domain-containing protein [Patescibacteria group bacterium]|nr:DUF11 domain-containing protein [Patescibacteria group bacterium]